MKKFFHFVLPFLFERNWHTGEHEVVHLRLWLFLAAVALVVIAAVFGVVMQSPVVYSDV